MTASQPPDSPPNDPSNSASLSRQPEPELMDLPDEAQAYADADFAEVNARYVQRLAQLVDENVPHFAQPTGSDDTLVQMVDLGTGPGDIAFRVADRFGHWAITAVDGAQAMLDLARQEWKTRASATSMTFHLADALQTGLPGQHYQVVLSNSILHHVRDAVALWKEVKRLAAPGALIFFRDLYRPASQQAAREIVQTHAGNESELLQEEFYRSLLSAYTADEITDQLELAGLEMLDVQLINDRHVDICGQLPIK